MKNEFCTYCPCESEHVCGPAEEEWYRKHSNGSHPFVKEKLVFLRQFAKFLAVVRREQLSCVSEDSFDSIAT